MRLALTPGEGWKLVSPATFSLLSLLLVRSAVGQQAGSLDTGFNTGSGAAGSSLPWVATLAVQGDGRILVAGPFSQFNGVTSRRLARLNSDGSLDTSFSGYSGHLVAGLGQEGKELLDAFCLL